MSDEGVCRTAPATPGLLIICSDFAMLTGGIEIPFWVN